MQPASMQDWFEINNLFIRYATSLDHGDVDAVVGCFTADGVIESPILGAFSGIDGIRAFAEHTARMKREEGVQFRHVVADLVVRVDGDTAEATCYLLDFVTRNERTKLLSPGEYVCQLRRVDGAWRFVRRIVQMDQPFRREDM